MACDSADGAGVGHGDGAGVCRDRDRAGVPGELVGSGRTDHLRAVWLWLCGRRIVRRVLEDAMTTHTPGQWFASRVMQDEYGYDGCTVGTFDTNDKPEPSHIEDTICDVRGVN